MQCNRPKKTLVSFHVFEKVPVLLKSEVRINNKYFISIIQCDFFRGLLGTISSGYEKPSPRRYERGSHYLWLYSLWLIGVEYIASCELFPHQLLQYPKSEVSIMAVHGSVSCRRWLKEAPSLLIPNPATQ